MALTFHAGDLPNAIKFGAREPDVRHPLLSAVLAFGISSPIDRAIQPI